MAATLAVRDWRQEADLAPHRIGVMQSRGEVTGRSPGRRGEPSLWQRVRTLESIAAAERGRARARWLSEAGDLLAEGGLPVAAATRYGGAIDAYLEAGYFSFAQRMCMRLLEAAPRAVRVHATLALILMGRGLREEAESLLRDYVAATRDAGQAHLALRRLCLMAQAVTDDELRATILGHIDRLRVDARIDANPCASCGAACQLAGSAGTAPGAYWERLVDIGVRGPRELAAATPHWDAAAWLSAGSLAAHSLGPTSAPA